MSGSPTLLRLDLASVPTLDAKSWRDDLVKQRRAGARVVSMFGRRDGDRCIVTSVLEPQGLPLRVSRAELTIELGYHELTTEWPALHCFERELHEQTGVRIAGHPWLKPIRYEGAHQEEMGTYPFFKIEGKEVHEVAVGPIHAGVIEPGSFRFMCHGEQVRHLEIQLGYQHRGVEKLLLRKNPLRLTPLVETIAGDSSIAHAWAHAAALEALGDCALDTAIDVGRAVMLELERVAMHLAALSGISADIGFLQGATTYGRLRTTAINTTMRLCGSRFGRGAIRPGGIGISIDAELFADVMACLALLSTDVAIINERFLESRTVRHRLVGTGIVTGAQAHELGLVGLVARASGIGLDRRHDAREGAYGIVPIEPRIGAEGDCWARTSVRIAEIDSSLSWLKSILGRFTAFRPARKPTFELAPNQLAIALVEGARGEVFHAIETNDVGAIEHYKVQDPSLRNWMGLAIAVRENEISDFPICNKSFDLSYCGNDL